jgi:hypothetical protein
MRLCSGQGTLRWLRRLVCVCAWFRWLLEYVPVNKEGSILLWNGPELILVVTVLISCWKSSLVLFSEAWEALVINKSVSDRLAQSSGWRIEPCGRIMGFWLNVGWGVKVARRWMFGWVSLESSELREFYVTDLDCFGRLKWLDGSLCTNNGIVNDAKKNFVQKGTPLLSSSEVLHCLCQDLTKAERSSFDRQQEQNLFLEITLPGHSLRQLVSWWDLENSGCSGAWTHKAYRKIW